MDKPASLGERTNPIMCVASSGRLGKPAAFGERRMRVPKRSIGAAWKARRYDGNEDMAILLATGVAYGVLKVLGGMLTSVGWK